jgi:hypothetical protein
MSPFPRKGILPLRLRRKLKQREGKFSDNKDFIQNF